MTNMKEYWDDQWANRYVDRGDIPSEFVKEICEYIKDKKIKTILDLGCGAGRDAYFMYKKGYKITALDISNEAMKFLKEKAPDIEFICEDITKFDFPSKKFDLVLANLSIHYFDDVTTKRIIDGIKNSLTERGVFCVRCKSTKDPLFGQGEEIAKNTFKNEEHLRHFFDEEYMRKILEDFTIEQTKETQGFYYKPSAFIEVIASKK